MRQHGGDPATWNAPDETDLDQDYEVGDYFLTKLLDHHHRSAR